MLVQAGIEPVLQLTCRDRNRIALQGDLLGAAAFGVRNLLVLRGDDPAAGDQPDATAVFDLDSRALMRTAVALRDEGRLPSGRAVQGRPRFFIGAADTPIDPPARWSPDTLKGKVQSGAEFIQTQFCMDLDIVRRYVRRLSDCGVLESVSVLIGIVPLRSARSGIWMRNHLFGTIIPDALIDRISQSADQEQEGRRVCVEMLQQLAAIPQVAGAHIMAPSKEQAIPLVVAAAGSIPRRTGSAPVTSGCD